MEAKLFFLCLFMYTCPGLSVWKHLKLKKTPTESRVAAIGSREGRKKKIRATFFFFKPCFYLLVFITSWLFSWRNTLVNRFSPLLLSSYFDGLFYPSVLLVLWSLAPLNMAGSGFTNKAAWARLHNIFPRRQDTSIKNANPIVVRGKVLSSPQRDCMEMISQLLVHTLEEMRGRESVEEEESKWNNGALIKKKKKVGRQKWNTKPRW